MAEEIWQYKAYDAIKKRYDGTGEDGEHGPKNKWGRVVQALSIIEKVLARSPDEVMRRYAKTLETCEISYSALYDIHFGESR